MMMAPAPTITGMMNPYITGTGGNVSRFNINHTYWHHDRRPWCNHHTGRWGHYDNSWRWCWSNDATGQACDKDGSRAKC